VKKSTIGIILFILFFFLEGIALLALGKALKDPHSIAATILIFSTSSGMIIMLALCTGIIFSRRPIDPVTQKKQSMFMTIMEKLRLMGCFLSLVFINFELLGKIYLLRQG